MTQLAVAFAFSPLTLLVQAEVLASYGCSEETVATITDESAEEVQRHAEIQLEVMLWFFLPCSEQPTKMQDAF